MYDDEKTVQASNINRELKGTVNKKQMPPNATSNNTTTMSSRATNQVDGKIAGYAKKLEGEKSNVQHQVKYLKNIRILLKGRILDMRDMSVLRVDLGPVVIDILRQHQTGGSRNEPVTEECAGVLYFLSVLDPTFKKGVARLFKAMEDHKDNENIQEDACAAICNISARHPDSYERIAPSIGVILKSMQRHPENVKLHKFALKFLANLASQPATQPAFISSGALKHVLTTMSKHIQSSSIQATACRALYNLSLDSRYEITKNMVPFIPLVLRGMRQYPNDPKVQLYGCCTLRNLSKLYRERIASAGGIATILVAMKEHAEVQKVQEQGCATLCNLLSEGKGAIEDVRSTTNDGGVPIIVEAMKLHPHVLELQTNGLGLLSCLSSVLTENHELIFSEGGLDVILSAMATFENHLQLAQIGCEFLKNFARQSLDFQRALTAKGGIVVVLTAMRKHVQDLKVQDSAFACMRNLCTHQDNRLPVKEGGGISTLLVNMSVHAANAAIQAYGLDALGRLGLEPDNRTFIQEENGIDVALEAMQGHTGHPGVQDRACFMLLVLAEDRPALLSIRDKDALPMLREAKSRMPNAAALNRCEKLVKLLEKEQGWFFGRKSTA